MPRDADNEYVSQELPSEKCSKVQKRSFQIVRRGKRHTDVKDIDEKDASFLRSLKESRKRNRKIREWSLGYCHHHATERKTAAEIEGNQEIENET